MTRPHRRASRDSIRPLDPLAFPRETFRPARRIVARAAVAVLLVIAGGWWPR